MLGQPISMLFPEVIGFELTGEMREGVTATDLVLTVTEMLRDKGVVGKFVEFFGTGLDNLPLEDRATIANMAPGIRRNLWLLSRSITRRCAICARRAAKETHRAGRGLCQGERHVARGRLRPVYTDTLAD